MTVFVNNSGDLIEINEETNSIVITEQADSIIISEVGLKGDKGDDGADGNTNVFIGTTDPALATPYLWIDTTGGNLNFWVNV